MVSIICRTGSIRRNAFFKETIILTPSKKLIYIYHKTNKIARKRENNLCMPIHNDQILILHHNFLDATIQPTVTRRNSIKRPSWVINVLVTCPAGQAKGILPSESVRRTLSGKKPPTFVGGLVFALPIFPGRGAIRALPEADKAR